MERVYNLHHDNKWLEDEVTVSSLLSTASQNITEQKERLDKLSTCNWEVEKVNTLAVLCNGHTMINLAYDMYDEWLYSGHTEQSSELKFILEKAFNIVNSLGYTWDTEPFEEVHKELMEETVLTITMKHLYSFLSEKGHVTVEKLRASQHTLDNMYEEDILKAIYNMK